MKIKILRTRVYQGLGLKYDGDIVENVDPEIAQQLALQGFAEPYQKERLIKKEKIESDEARIKTIGNDMESKP